MLQRSQANSIPLASKWSYSIRYATVCRIKYDDVVAPPSDSGYLFGRVSPEKRNAVRKVLQALRNSVSKLSAVRPSPSRLNGLKSLADPSIPSDNPTSGFKSSNEQEISRNVSCTLSKGKTHGMRSNSAKAASYLTVLSRLGNRQQSPRLQFPRLSERIPGGALEYEFIVVEKCLVFRQC